MAGKDARPTDTNYADASSHAPSILSNKGKTSGAGFQPAIQFINAAS